MGERGVSEPWGRRWLYKYKIKNEWTSSSGGLVEVIHSRRFSVGAYRGNMMDHSSCSTVLQSVLLSSTRLIV